MPRVLRVLAVALLSSLPLIAAAQSQDLVGNWILRPEGQPLPPDAILLVLAIKHQNGAWNGDMKRGGRDYPLVDFAIVDGTVSFKMGDAETGFFTWRGRRSGDELRFEMKRPGAAAPLSVVYRRASAEDLARLRAEPPVVFEKLPLPRQKDLNDDGLARTPPMGVGNWVNPPSDKAVREVVDQMVSSGLRDAGYVYILLDAGWQGRRDAQGALHPNRNFPDMKALANYVHSRGMKLGLYSSPGPLDCVGAAGSHGHEEQDAKTFAEWGIDYLKYDWCSAGELYQTQLEMRAAYQKMGEALRATGRPIVYSVCQYGLFDVGTWARKVGAHGWRTGRDIVDSWISMSESGFESKGMSEHAGPGGWNDPDNLQIGKGGMSTEEYRTQMTLWSMMAAPLIIELRGNDLRKLSPGNKEILLNSEVIAIDQDTLGKQGRRVLQRGTVEVWSKPLSDGATGVALFNRGEVQAKVTLRWDEVEVGDVQHVRDLWRGEDLGRLTKGYEANVPAHGSILLRVKDAR